MKVVIACGGSGGHVIPGRALASRLRALEREIEILFVVSRKAVDRRMLGEEKAILALPVVGMPYTFSWRFPFFAARFALSLGICFCRMLRFKPDIFVGFGGYVSGPVIVTGLILRKPTVIHEENFIPGRANLWLSRWVTRVGVAFEETKEFFGKNAPVVCVGNPLRHDLVSLPAVEARHYFGLKQDRFTLLLSGGSQGAHRLNRAMVEALGKLPPEEREALQVIHLTGDKDAAWVTSRYEALGVPARVYPFLDRMGEAYSAADLVVARGGAMTLTEIGHFRKPALFVPLTMAKNHQLENVRYLAKRGACVLFDEGRAMTEEFPREILNLKRDDSRRKDLSQRLASFYPGGTAEKLAKEIFALAEKGD